MTEKYHCTEEGIRLADSDLVTWEYLADCLARHFHPGSSAPEIRRDLESAIKTRQVEGRVDILRKVLAATCPKRALEIAINVHPSDIDPEGWAESYNQIKGE